jgi:hypothetical protein
MTTPRVMSLVDSQRNARLREDHVVQRGLIHFDQLSSELCRSNSPDMVLLAELVPAAAACMFL